MVAASALDVVALGSACSGADSHKALMGTSMAVYMQTLVGHGGTPFTNAVNPA